MPKCFAVNCYTKSESGNKLFLIPQGQRNIERRKIWLQRMGRKEQEIFQSTRLCEFHFTPDQFEWNRKDGVIKLKPNAVPTIFNPRPAKGEPSWKRRKCIAVKEPPFIKCEPGLEEDTRPSSSSLFISRKCPSLQPNVPFSSAAHWMYTSSGWISSEMTSTMWTLNPEDVEET